MYFSILKVKCVLIATFINFYVLLRRAGNVCEEGCLARAIRPPALRTQGIILGIRATIYSKRWRKACERQQSLNANIENRSRHRELTGIDGKLID